MRFLNAAESIVSVESADSVGGDLFSRGCRQAESTLVVGLAEPLKDAGGN